MENPVITAIYKITSPSGKVYIGQAVDVRRRFREYTYLWKSKSQNKLNCSFKSHSIATHKFEIIHELPKDIEQSILNKYEQFYMDRYRECGVELLNLSEVGERRTISPEGIEKLRVFHTGKILSEETKKRISESRKGKCTGKNNPMYKVGLVGEAKEKMRNSKKGKKQSDETIEKRVKNSRKSIIQLTKSGEIIKYWQSQTKAGKELNIKYQSIGECCRGTLLSAGGFKWKFKTIENE